MTQQLPVLDAQLAFSLQAQRTGRRHPVTVTFEAKSGRWDASRIADLLGGLLANSAGLSYDIQFRRGQAVQTWNPRPVDFAEVFAGDSASQRAIETQLLRHFQQDFEGGAMQARLIRGPAEHFLLMFDHAAVDEASLRWIVAFLNRPHAVKTNVRAAHAETVIGAYQREREVATSGPSRWFWRDRLLEAERDFDRPRSSGAEGAPLTSSTLRPVPRIAGSKFPLISLSLHAALHEAMPYRPSTLIGYPWGLREEGVPEVVGCFMNTTLSVCRWESGDARLPASPVWRSRWMEELQHVAFPYTELSSLKAGFHGCVDGYLSVSPAYSQSIDIAGVLATPVQGPETVSVPATTPVLGAVVLGSEQMVLRVAGVGDADRDCAKLLGSWRRHLGALLGANH